VTLNDVIVLRLECGTLVLIPRDTPFVAIHHTPIAQFGRAAQLSEKSHRQLAREALPELAKLMKERTP